MYIFERISRNETSENINLLKLHLIIENLFLFKISNTKELRLNFKKYVESKRILPVHMLRFILLFLFYCFNIIYLNRLTAANT